MLGNHVDFLERIMDVSALKRKTNADNISNINTPGFKATKVEFEHLFDKQIDLSTKTSHEKHISKVFDDKGSVVLTKDMTTKERYDGNNVDLNQEMIEMIKNNHIFGMGVQAINKEFSLNKIAIGRQ